MRGLKVADQEINTGTGRSPEKEMVDSVTYQLNSASSKQINIFKNQESIFISLEVVF